MLVVAKDIRWHASQCISHFTPYKSRTSGSLCFHIEDVSPNSYQCTSEEQSGETKATKKHKTQGVEHGGPFTNIGGVCHCVKGVLLKYVGVVSCCLHYNLCN
jgi:hypothetical protein